MTPRISLVAVCCSKRLLEFLETAARSRWRSRLIGESFEQLDLRRGEGAHLDATCGQYTNEFPLLAKGNGQKVRNASGTQPWEIVLRADIGNVQRAMLADPAILWFINADLDPRRWVSRPK